MNARHIDLLPKLESAVTRKDWDELHASLSPKLFRTLESEELIAFPVLAKVAEILTADNALIPQNIKIACLKCLGNSCFNGYVHKEYPLLNVHCGTFYHKLYSDILATNKNVDDSSDSYPFNSHFPYDGVIEWTANFITSSKIDNDLSVDQLEILRLSIQFLCNLFTFAYKDNTSQDEYNIPNFLNDTNLKSKIMSLTHFDHAAIVRASCMLIHNALKKYGGKSFTESEKVQLCKELVNPIKEEFESAKEALLFLLCHSNVLEKAYNDMIIEDKLHLLETIYNEISESAFKNKEECIFTKETIEFLSERFCKRSDLILKTVDTYLDGIEPTEIIILLNILGSLTSDSTIQEYNFLKKKKSLLINCIFLLKSIHMVGRESNNYFTPLQKLSDVAPAMQQMTISNERKISSDKSEHGESETKANKKENSLYNHPAFGFKVGLIRIIGNMSYKNKECQDFLREMDSISLLLDCCNIDARNPLIMQWTILALRNLCEGNLENQGIIQNCTRAGVVENSVLQEMGLTLHEDEEGKKIGIVPLPRNSK